MEAFCYEMPLIGSLSESEILRVSGTHFFAGRDGLALKLPRLTSLSDSGEHFQPLHKPSTRLSVPHLLLPVPVSRGEMAQTWREMSSALLCSARDLLGHPEHSPQLDTAPSYQLAHTGALINLIS